MNKLLNRTSPRIELSAVCPERASPAGVFVLEHGALGSRINPKGPRWICLRIAMFRHGLCGGLGRGSVLETTPRCVEPLQFGDAG
jgi:hypothetical protein